VIQLFRDESSRMSSELTSLPVASDERLRIIGRVDVYDDDEEDLSDNGRTF